MRASLLAVFAIEAGDFARGFAIGGALFQIGAFIPRNFSLGNTELGFQLAIFPMQIENDKSASADLGFAIEFIDLGAVEQKFADSFRGGKFPSVPTDSRVCNNLILGGERVQGGADQWEPVLSAWKFAGNFWEIDDTTKRSANYDERIAVFRDKFDVPVRDVVVQTQPPGSLQSGDRQGLYQRPGSDHVFRQADAAVHPILRHERLDA
jgi:hypothetical protein